MFNNRILKILALLMVMNILIVPLTSFTPQQQNKYKVYAAEGIVDIRFFNAVISMIGITAAGLATMSPTFSIPEVDLVEMKNNFEQSLEADAVKKQAWIAAQTDYLAGGIAKTMGAVELAKIGINDIYTQFKDYVSSKFIIMPLDPTIETVNTEYENFNVTTYLPSPEYLKYAYYPYTYSSSISNVVAFNTDVIFNLPSYTENILYFYINDKYNETAAVIEIYVTYDQMVRLRYVVENEQRLNTDMMIYIVNKLSEFGIDILLYYPNYDNDYKGYIKNPDIVNVDNDSISIIPTIPWIDNDIPIGTIVTPAISAPYAGAVPIDVPITAPIDPPIEEPVDPPADATLIGTVAAILAGITPISAILDNILASELDIADVIEVGITDVIDGIGDIAGTLTDGITTSLTDIQTSIGSLLDPPTETLDLDKLKNLNSVLFTKFPFSIPFDFIAIVTAINADPVAPVLTIPFNMQDFGGSNSNVEIDLSIYDNFANIARQIGFIGFVIFMLFNTRKLIWK